MNNIYLRIINLGGMKMNELIAKHKEDVKKIMERYKKETEEFLKLADEVYEAEYSFRKNIAKMLSPESYQKGLDTYLSEYERISEILKQKETDYKRIFDDSNANNVEFSISIQTNVMNNTYSKDEVKTNMEKLTEEFGGEYSKMIKDYNDTINKVFEKIDKEVTANRKFVIEYGGFTFTPDETIENEYKPIYDKHDEVDDKFIFDFQTRALVINWIPENIKNEYSLIIKQLDDNYDVFKDIFGE